MTVSMVKRCYETETHPIGFDEIWDAIRTGKHGLKEKITLIRNRYEAEKDITGDVKKAKKAVADLKQELPGFLPSGTFTKRDNAALVEHSGILCADFDAIGDALPVLREHLKTVTFVHAIAISPSGDGLKVFFNVIKDAQSHEDSFRAIRSYMLDTTGFDIDEKCKDPARICFFTYDENLWVREEGDAAILPAEPLPKKEFKPNPNTNLVTRELICRNRLQFIEWNPELNGYFVVCPGKEKHGNATVAKHTIIYLEGVNITLDCQHESCFAEVKAMNDLLRSEVSRAEYAQERKPAAHGRNGEEKVEEPKIWVEFLSPSQIVAYKPPENLFMVGDCHIMLGATAVIGGPPSVGKSRALFQLAYCGATGADFMGMKVHRTFRTLILQNENGKWRLLQQYKLYDYKVLDDFIRISPPPPFGMAFQKEGFREQMKRALEEFQPELFAVDPFNSIAYEQDSREYLLAIDTLRAILPRGDDAPALLIAHHTRKPKTEDRASGRALMHLLAGSYVLSSIPRCIWMMQQASNDVMENGIVWTCCKNNDGELGPRSAWDWDSKTGLYHPLSNFDWDDFDLTEKERHDTIKQSDVEAVLKDTPMKKGDAVKALKVQVPHASERTRYRAIDPKGKFSNHLAINKDGVIRWIP